MCLFTLCKKINEMVMITVITSSSVTRNSGALEKYPSRPLPPLSLPCPKSANLLKVSSTCTRRPYTPWVGSVAIKHSSLWYRDVPIFIVTGKLFLIFFVCNSGPPRLCPPCPVEHSNSRFESIRFYSLCESIPFDSFSKKNRPFDSLVVMQFFLFIYCIVSAK